MLSYTSVALSSRQLELVREPRRVAASPIYCSSDLDQAPYTAPAADTPLFVLKGVTDFNVHRSSGVPDSQRAGPIVDEKL